VTSVGAHVLTGARTECVVWRSSHSVANHAYAQLRKEVVEGRFAARFDLDPRLHDTRRCVVGGMTGSSSPWLAVVTSGSVSPAKTQIRPVANRRRRLRSKIMSAIGVTTVMTLRP